MKKLLIGIVVLLVVIVAALFVVPPLVPADVYKDQIASQVRDATGRELDIKGDMSFSLLPSVAIEASDVAFANAPEASAANMATLKELVVELKVFPLISGQVEVNRFVLVEPVINLEVDERGTPNWAFRPGAAQRPAANTSGAPAETGETGETGEAGVGVRDIRLGDVRIADGTINYVDARSGQQETVSRVNLTLSLKSFDSPFDAEGGLLWHGKTVKLSAYAGSPSDLLAGESTGVRLGVESEVVTLAFDGTVKRGKRLRAQGPVKLDVPSVRNLADWVDSPIEMAGTGLGPLKIDGQLALQGAAVSFSNAKIALDDIRAEGGFTLTDAKVPHIKGRLDVERLDLNPYLGRPEGAPAAAAKPAETGQTAPATPAAAPRGWSDEPIDASALRSVNADLTLTAKELIYQKIKVGKSALEINLKGGRLVVDLTELALYKGAGRGRIVVDASKPALRIEESFELAGIEAEPFLRDGAGFDRLQGTADAKVKVAGTGRSQAEIVKSLMGDGAIKFSDGAVKGLNLAAMVRSVSLESLTKGVSPAQQTDFSELSGTFVITRGILKNNDLIMLSPLLRVSGAGTSNLPARTVNYRIEPKAVATIQGQGGPAQKRGLVVPVLVTGPWHDLKFAPDLKGILQVGPEGIVGAAKSITEGVKKGGIGGILKGLTGQGAAPTEPQAPAREAPKPPQQIIDPKDPVGTIKKLLPGFN